MRLRQGRKNPHTLYLQQGDEPDGENDLPVGFVLDPEVARLICEGFTSPWHLGEISMNVLGLRVDPDR